MPIDNPRPAKAATLNRAEKGDSADGPRVGEVFAGRYLIERHLGLGSLCSNFLCIDKADGDQEKVLKVLLARKAADPHLAQGFIFLADSVSRYRHPGINRVLETGTHLGSAYYTSSFISGKPMRIWLLEKLEFDQRVLPGLDLLKQLADIFTSIHELGCYGCLKPENVFLIEGGPVITDFGVVGFLTPQEFEFNTYARRYLPYMAPELRQDWNNLLPESDLYSLGAIAYEILAGRPPSPSLALPSQLSPRFGWEMDEFILKALAVDPEDRFHSASAFRRALEGVEMALKATLSKQAVSAQNVPDIAEAPIREQAAGTETIWQMVDEKSPAELEADSMEEADVSLYPEHFTPKIEIARQPEFAWGGVERELPARTDSPDDAEEESTPAWLVAILILCGALMVGLSLFWGLLSTY